MLYKDTITYYMFIDEPNELEELVLLNARVNDFLFKVLQSNMNKPVRNYYSQPNYEVTLMLIIKK